jgi:alpha-tubulin suppressor-like RCC1 family protein
MSIKTASQSQIGQGTAKNSQIVTTSVRLVNSGASTGPSISSIVVTDSSFSNNFDETVAATSNSFIRILGTSFTSTANVFLNGTMVPKANITFVSSSELRVRLPIVSAGNYALSVFNSNSSGALFSSSFVISTMPSWITSSSLSTIETEISFSTTLSASGDSTITYSNTTALPAGTTLASNGLFSGTVTVASNTTFNFDVKATDLQSQDVTRTFSMTVFVPIAAPRIYLWGDNTYGRGALGFASNYVQSPTQLGSSTDWSMLKCGPGQNTGAIKTNGTLWMWGFNRFDGRLGLNNIIDIASPAQVGATTNWSTVELASSGTMALKTDGTLWSWGNGIVVLIPYGQRSSPVQIGSNTNWSKISVGQSQSFGIKTDGTLWCWGGGTGPQFGSFGDNRGGNSSAFNTTSPKQVGTNTDWSLVNTSYHSSFAIKTDGTLWSWGKNTSGQLGQNNIIHRSSPTQIGSNTNWSKLASGRDNTFAIKTDGTLWAWGAGGLGQLGTNDQVSKSSPTQVGTANNWIDVATNNGSTAFTFATRGKKFSNTSGNLFVWGHPGADRQLGLSGDTAAKSSPVQLGSFDSWSVPSCGDEYGGAILK